MFYRFRYESKFYPMLDRVPLDVRRKLDLTGLKISLDEWLALSLEERKALCHLPVDSDEEKQVFTAYLDFLSRKYHGKAVEITEVMNRSLWDSAEVPEAVARKSAAGFNVVRPDEWSRWPSHHRYALYKTATSKKQPEAFADLLDELRGSSLAQTKLPPDGRS